MNPLTIVWDVDPIAFHIGSLEIAWYGILWTIAIGTAWWLFHKMIVREHLEPRMEETGFWYIVLGTIIGARLGHCLFYEPQEFFLDPFMSSFPYIKLLDIRGGGLASHGGAIGILVGAWLYCRRWKIPFIWMLDRMAVIVPICGALVRIGNLINSEVYGTVTNLPWGFVFVQNGEVLPMHPTQLYEAICYLLIFLLMAHLYWRTKAPDRRGLLFGIFLILLFGSRLFIEMIKNPQELFEENMVLNMGQILSIPFIVGGIAVLWVALKKPVRPYTELPQAETESRAVRRHKKK